MRHFKELLKRINWLKDIYGVVHGIQDPYIRKFIEHNRKIWNGYCNDKTNREILVRADGGTPRAIIAWAYFANVFAQKYNAKICSYSFSGRKLENYIDKHIAQSFGCNKHIFVCLSNEDERICTEKTNAIFQTLTVKEDLLRLRIDGIKVGIEIYDSYLRMGNPTVDLHDGVLKKLLNDAVRMVHFWSGYFANHDVKVVIVDPDRYMNFIIGDVACAYGIDVYSIGLGYGRKLSLEYEWEDQFKYYHKCYQQLPINLQKMGVAWAEKQLKYRMSGGIDSGISASTKSAFVEAKYRSKIALMNNNKVKILIATHDFFDSPHMYAGKWLFPDFYEWICHLGEIANNSNYEWYVKVHPDESEQSILTIKKLLRRYSKLHWVENNISHQQLVEEGIQFALTVHGSIGMEYPLFGIPVINSGYNPHIAYGFNMHPKSIEEYDYILNHLEQISFPIIKKDVYECYFMHCIFGLVSGPYRYRDDLIVHSINEMTNSTIGRWHDSIVYDYFLREFSEEWHYKTLENVEKYIQFMDHYRCNEIHIDDEVEQRVRQYMEVE